jgi:hypothetical protein
MAELSFSSAEVEKIKDLLHIPHFEIVVKSNWGSQFPGHREEIHGELKKRMAKAYPFSDSSISHCPDLGGFVFSIYDSNQMLRVGFDIESSARVTDRIAQRICITEEEFRRAPSSASLWAAKEAAFKSLKGPKQPAVVSEIELINWTQIDSQFETVSVKDCRTFESSRIQGVLFKKSSFTFAFFASIA